MTAQIHEELILNGRKTSMACCPELPENDQRIIVRSNDEIDAGLEELFVFTTACHRGYVGTWEIKDKQLFLLKLTGQYKLAENKPILADWFTGTLIIPRGKMIHYVHAGFASVHEGEEHISIDKGCVVSSIVIDNKNNDTP